DRTEAEAARPGRYLSVPFSRVEGPKAEYPWGPRLFQLSGIEEPERRRRGSHPYQQPGTLRKVLGVPKQQRRARGVLALATAGGLQSPHDGVPGLPVARTGDSRRGAVPTTRAERKSPNGHAQGDSAHHTCEDVPGLPATRLSSLHVSVQRT